MLTFDDERLVARLAALPAIALELLTDAAEKAEDCQRDPWQFAVEIRMLQQAGLTNNDLRWLICQDFVQHAIETVAPRLRVRRLRRLSSLALTDRTCFVLTQRGSVVVSQALHQVLGRGDEADPSGRYSPANCRRQVDNPSALSSVPRWDMTARELFWGSLVIKRFVVPAQSQEQILTEFERRAWPASILSPLVRVAGADEKRRLNDAIRGLNSCQQNHLLRFEGNGCGQGVRWRAIKEIPR